MGPVKFLPVPQKPIGQQSFDWDVQNLTEWLQRLSGSALDRTCEDLCTLLIQLNHTPLEFKLKSQMLQEISTYVKLYETRIDTLYLESALALSEYQQHCVEWLVWSFLQLGECFFLAAESAPGPEAKVLSLYRGLWAMSRAYLHISAVYCEPPDGFWASCYQRYAEAERDGLVDLKLLDDTKKSVTINQLFKQLMVFALCDATQFRPREMRKVFDFLGPFADRLTFASTVNDEHTSRIYAFDMEGDCGPLNLARHPQVMHQAGSRFFAPASLAKTIFHVLKQENGKAGALRAINKAVLMRMIRTLGQANSRQFQRTKEERVCRGIIGFSNIRDYLYKEDTPPEKIKIEPPRPGKPQMYDTSQFEVVAEGDEVVFQMGEHLRRKYGNDERITKILAASGGLAGKINVWGDKEDRRVSAAVNIDEFSLLNSSASGYGVAINNRPAQVKVGDLFAVVGDDVSAGIEVAVIRRIRRLFGDQLYLGVELIGIAKEAVMMQDGGEKGKKTEALFLPAIKALKQPDSLIYSSSEFDCGEFVSFSRGKNKVRCRLNRLINSTSSFSQAELFYPKVDEKE